ncbi:putative nuclear pore complex protein [Sesbania bispinosa]|nr:putative nuclear pore complex protein [Sesbania bispinosa]
MWTLSVCWTGEDNFENDKFIDLLSLAINILIFWQPWRAASLCPFGGLNQFPSVEALVKNGKNRTLQAVEFESGIGHQWHLWKWASYCTSEVVLYVTLIKQCS